MKKILLMIVMFISLQSFAATFIVDGIKYDTNDGKTVYVTSNDPKYEGDIVIPATVTYEGKTYDVTSIGGHAFENCSGLTSVTIPDGVTSIGWSAFRHCSGLTSINIPDGVTGIGSDAFSGCSGLTSINIPDGVTGIGEYAFSFCSGLKSITIPNSVTSIGRSAFNGCSGLTSINIPDGVTSIGRSAFNGCSSLTSINIPDGVTSIEERVFDGCNSLTSVTIPDGVTSIGDEAFCHCSGLTSVTIGNGVTSIGEDVFRDCYGLTRVDYMGTIGDWLKINFSGLLSNPLYYAKHLYIDGKEVTDVVIPDDVTSIGAYTFYGCGNLTSVTIGDGVTSIGEYAFYGCGLRSITIPDGVTSIGSDAFKYCYGLTRVDYMGTIGDWLKINFSNFSSNPLSYAKHLHIDGKEVTDVVIPDGVTSIGDYAFENCSGLTSITIPDGVTVIGSYAFYDCYSLTSITIPNSVTSIGSDAFSRCSNLKEVHTDMADPSILKSALGTSKKYIVPCSLYDTYVAAGLTVESEHNLVRTDAVAETCTADGNTEYYTCNGCSKHFADEEMTTEIAADSWVIPASHDLVWSDAVAATDEADGHVEGYTCNVCGRHFADSKASVEILEKDWIDKGWSLSDDGVLTITRNYDFVDYWKMEKYPWYSSKDDIKSVVIKDGVTSIGHYAFYGCSSLTSITIPSSVTNIGEYAFYGCNSLTTLNFNAEKCAPMANDYGGYGYVFDGCSSLTTVNIGESVEYIPSYAFYGCSGLTSITIPDGVTSIGYCAFLGCSGLSSISVDADNQYFDSRDNCNAIIETSTNTLIVGCKNTIIPDDVTSIGTAAFGGCRGLTSINIPDGVTSIGSDAFLGCSSLTSINIPDGVTIIEESVFNGCISLTSVTIPDGVTSIRTIAFSNCKSLTSIAIPDGVTSIEYGAFKDCQGLKNVTIPNSITSMEWGVFFMCDNLEYVNTDMTDPSILIDQFGTDKTYVVPCALYDTYVAAGLTTESEHLFTTYTYNNDAEVGVDGTETAYCDNNCGHTDTRTAEGTKLNPTGIENIKADGHKVVKTIEDGKIVIIRDGEKFDVMGRKIR